MAGKMTYIPAIVAVVASLLALTNSNPAPVAGPSVCSGREQFHADPTNCNAYYQCANGRGIIQHCEPGLHWNAKNNVCDWPEHSGCIEVLSQDVVPVPAVEEEVEEGGGNVENEGTDADDEEEKEQEVGKDGDVENEGADAEAEEKKEQRAGDVENEGADAEEEESGDAENESVDVEEEESGDVENKGIDVEEEQEEEGDDVENESADAKEVEKEQQKEEKGDVKNEGAHTEEEEESGDDVENEGVDAEKEEEEIVVCPADSNKPNCPADDSANSVFFRHFDPHWFYHCSNGVAYCKQCPAELVWNVNCNTCDREGQNNCPDSKAEIAERAEEMTVQAKKLLKEATAAVRNIVSTLDL